MEGELAISKNIYSLYCVTHHKTQQLQYILKRQGDISLYSQI